MSRVLILKSPTWGGMPVLHAVPYQLRILAAKHPVAQEWLRLVDTSQIEEVIIEEDAYPRLIEALREAGIIHAGRAAELRRM